jgi:hypothetical protein
VFAFLQQNPIVVETIRQPAAAPDISIQYVLGMFMMAGAVLAFAGVGGIIVGGLFVLYRKHREKSEPANPTNDLRLRI